jgi:hypothetical protein
MERRRDALHPMRVIHYQREPAMASQKPPQDAIALLTQDHKEVKELFDEFKKFQESEQTGVDDLKQELMDVVCASLSVHAQIEEEIFYPAAREALPDEEDLLNEAEVEHAGAKDLIAQIQDGSADDPMTCAKFIVLSEYIEHHVKEEQGEMFPKVRDSDMDTKAVGAKLAARKEELMNVKAIAPSIPPKASLWDRLSAARPR